MSTRLTHNRRLFLKSAGLGLATWRWMPGEAAAAPQLTGGPAMPDQLVRDEVEAFGRSLWNAKDALDAAAFASHFADPHTYQDAPLNGHCGSLAPRQALADRYGGGMFKIAVAGKFCKFVHATGDMRYGVVTECTMLPGFVAASVDQFAFLELKDGLIARNVDYWDTAQIGPEALQFHPDGVPRQRPACDPIRVPNDPPHASPAMRDFTQRVQSALAAGRTNDVLDLFADDALFIHPLLYMGPPDVVHRGFNLGIQIRGKQAIARLLKTVPALPDGAHSTLMNVVGGSVGGGYEWKAGGDFARQGLDREGIRGATALDIVDGRISRMSVKFDTMQMTRGQRMAVRTALGKTR